MTLTTSFASTQVSLDKSLNQIEGLLEAHGVREQRYTHLKPETPDETEGDGALGRLIYEFVWPGASEPERRGVRITVCYQPTVIKIQARTYRRKAVKGTTAQMAARALFWFLKAKFDAIDYGIEEFDVAFMPHLLTQIGQTFAERPELLSAALSDPESLALDASRLLPAGAH